MRQPLVRGVLTGLQRLGVPDPVVWDLAGLMPTVAQFAPWPAVLARSTQVVAGLPDITGPRVLFATGVGGAPYNTLLDGLMAMAVRLRGADAHLLLCDAMLSACELSLINNYGRVAEYADHGPRRSFCDWCGRRGQQAYSPLPMPLHRYGQFVSADEARQLLEDSRDYSVADCFEYVEDGLALGRMVKMGANRFFLAGAVDDTPSTRPIVQRYLAAARLTRRVMERACDTLRPKVVVAHHGMYVPQGVIGQVARARGLRVVNHSAAYRRGSVIYSHHDAYHITFQTDPASDWEHLSLTESQQAWIENYLRSRRQGSEDRLSFQVGAVEDVAALQRQLGLDLAKPSVGLLTNVLWDSSLYYDTGAFVDQLDWLFTTLEYYRQHPEVQLVVRVHPAEVLRSPSRQTIQAEIARRLPGDLPAHIRVVPPDWNLSTYQLMELCRAAIIYGTKTGLELACAGIPVIVAGGAWIRNKDIGFDAHSRDEYLALLDRAPAMERLTAAQVQRAKTFAFHYFNRVMIPLSCLRPGHNGRGFALGIRALDELQPGRDPGLDTICRGILSGAPFVFDDPAFAGEAAGQAA